MLFTSGDMNFSDDPNFYGYHFMAYCNLANSNYASDFTNNMIHAYVPYPTCAFGAICFQF